MRDATTTIAPRPLWLSASALFILVACGTSRRFVAVGDNALTSGNDRCH